MGERFLDGGALTSVLRDFLAGSAPGAAAPRVLKERFGDRPGPGQVLCLGKAAQGLAAAARSLWPEAPGLLYGVPGGAAPPGFLDLRGDHPEPSLRNARNTEEVREWLRRGRGDLLALVSGGGSALLVAPRHPWTLEEKAGLASRLLASGAPIRDVNAVRVALSQVKGGGLLEDLGGRTCLTGIWSDTGPGQARLVASAPTLPWRPAVSAERVLRAWGVGAPRSFPPARPRIRRPADRWFLLADGVSLRRRAAAFLRGRGLAVQEVPVGEGEAAEDLARRITARAASALGAGGPPRAWIGVGEATVAVPSPGGSGGRCSHLAAAVALRMRNAPSDAAWAFSALATDGVDCSGDGGAFTDHRRAPAARRLRDALAGGNTAALWRREGTSVPREPSGNNLRDLWVLVVK
jgi:hydroxypyruvate reductase